MQTTNIRSDVFEPLIRSMEEKLNQMITDMIFYSAREGKVSADIDVSLVSMIESSKIVPMFNFKVTSSIPIKKTDKSAGIGNGQLYLGERTYDESAYVLRRLDGQISIDDLADQIDASAQDDKDDSEEEDS